MMAKTPHFERNRKILGFAIAFVIIGLFTIAIGVANDFVLNADWKNEELTKYGEFGKGVWLAEARYDVNHDIIHAMKSLGKNTTTLAYYKDLVILPSLIKYNRNNSWTIPHELGHHFFYVKMNKSERENWCNTFDWANWSYSGECDEGFAEWFGTEVIKYAPLVIIEEYNLTDGITKWRSKE